MEDISSSYNLKYEAKRLGLTLHREMMKNSLDPKYSSNVRLSQDRMSASGSKNWGTAFTKGCADSGKWYFEVKINSPIRNFCDSSDIYGWDACQTISDTKQIYTCELSLLEPNIRVGWGTRLMCPSAPVGYNPYGYAITSRPQGKIIHRGLRRSRGGLGREFEEGDIIGLFLSLPEKAPYILEDPRGVVELWPFLKEGLLCDITNDGTLPHSKKTPKSFIAFSFNGKFLGRAYENIACAEYHPCISLYMGASASINLGPDFAFPPSDNSFRPACEMNESRYPCKEDLVKFWVLSTETEEVSRKGEKRMRHKTVAEIEGIWDKKRFRGSLPQLIPNDFHKEKNN